MPSTTPSPTLLSSGSRPATTLDSLQPVGSSHEDVRRYSRARRNLLPRSDPVTAVCGGWAHEAVLRSHTAIESVLWCPGPRAHAELEASAVAAAARASRAFRISERTLARIHPDATAPELLSVVRLPVWDAIALLADGARLVLVADGIEYAGNLGTLVRTVDACAADALVLTGATARVTHPKVFTASRGTVLTTPVLTFGSVPEARSALAAAGFTAYVADPAAATSYRRAGLGRVRTAVVVGSEGSGVSDQWREGLTRVSIPMRGRADSLNVAVSAAVLLFEARARLDDD